MQTTNDILRTHLVCCISRELPINPVECPCGHLFDYTNIVQWLPGNNICPVSRRPMTTHDLVYSQTVRNLIIALNINTDLHSTQSASQTEDVDSIPPLELLTPVPFVSTLNPLAPEFVPSAFLSVHDAPIPDIPVINGPLAPFVSYSDRSLISADLSNAQLQYLGGCLLVDCSLNLFNPNSSNVDIADDLRHGNMTYIIRLARFQCTHPHLKILRYVYQHRSDDVLEVARHLQRAGYFVYDLFELANRVVRRPTLHRYVLYSADTLVDGSPNLLSCYRRLSTRV